MTPLRWRRAAIAAIGIVIAAALARPEVANGLVARGDEIAAAGDEARAQVYYRRAIAIDASGAEALDRLALTALMRDDAAAKDQAIVRLRATLAMHPNTALLFDLALLQLQKRRYAASAQTFRHLDRIDPSVLFAAATRIAARRARVGDR